MASDLYFIHLMQELFSGPYLEGLDLNLRKNKERKPKGPLTKNLLDMFPKVFAVVEDDLKEFCSDHLARNLLKMESSPEEYIKYSLMMCFTASARFKSTYDRFVCLISVIIITAEMLYITTGSNFYKLTPLILTAFFEYTLRKDFDKRGGWKHLEKHLLNKKYVEYYDKFLTADFAFDGKRKRKVRSLAQRPGLPFDNNDAQIKINTLEVQHLGDKVMLCIENSLLMELREPKLKDEQSISKVPESSGSIDASSNFDIRDTDTMDCSEIDYLICESHLKVIEEKLRDLISIFELLEAK
ncbi:uncharacterized protein NPIL_448231 [Nephila pilipes]|uniref:Uncharacterized protein n=1 Tax=Nephila pilipes TaxID=299642 RepID=A0A8X6J9U1_NEPPI|nr:uncharacterized protein NPIL_448231 [Nephila pilipes]